MTGFLKFRPVDAAARDGACHLVRDAQRMQYCARFSKGRWRYNCGKAISAEIVEVCSRG